MPEQQWADSREALLPLGKEVCYLLLAAVTHFCANSSKAIPVTHNFMLLATTPTK